MPHTTIHDVTCGGKAESGNVPDPLNLTQMMLPEESCLCLFFLLLRLSLPNLKEARMSIFEKNYALQRLANDFLPQLCQSEQLDEAVVRQAIEDGRIVLLGNPAHKNVRPILIGQPSRVKVNANIGTSPLSHCPQSESEKLRVALEAGADTVMDLSIAGDLDGIRCAMLRDCPAPVGTVPIYAVGQQLLDADKPIKDMTIDMLLAEIEKQATQGVDYMTVHCGLTRRGAAWANGTDTIFNTGRKMGIVSRGGAMLARWMLEHDRENPLLEDFDAILHIAREYNVTLSLGDGLRPGAGCDAGDAAQWEEVMTLGALALRARAFGVQSMIEGPGHVPLQHVEAQITGIKRLTHDAPLYVLGPLVVDSAPGYDHMAGGIGGAIAVRAGVDFLCYLTPAEHLTLPDASDVHEGVMAARVAAHAGEVALGRPHALAREKAMNEARRNLDWDAMAAAALDPKRLHKRREAHKQEDVCAMCGKFCAVKMLKEAQPFMAF